MTVIDRDSFCIKTSSIWQLIGYFLFVLKVVVPLIIIILGVIDLVKALTSSKDDEVNNAAKMLAIRAVIGISIFFIPSIISLIFSFIKSASPYVSAAEACQSCLLKPFYEDCTNYKAYAKKTQDDKKDELSQGKDDEDYKVHIESCYYCANDKKYVWTYSPECSDRIYIQNYKTQEDCEDANGFGDPLTKEEVETMHAQMATPTYQELLDFAQEYYGMSEAAFKVVFGWAVNEGYDRAKNLSGEVDTYLGYLNDCVGINHYMRGKTDPDELARSIGGADTRYTASSLTNKANSAINNPKDNAPFFKGMYLALKYPDENAHDCYGPSQADQNWYKSQGGELYYQGKAYPGAANYPIQVWTLYYDGFKHWKEEM